jgi:hypothetical protein
MSMNSSESEQTTGGLFWRYKWQLALVLIAALVGYWAVRDPWSSNVSTKMLPLRSSSSDEEIRKLLLSHTPIGSKAMNVLKFVLDDLQPKEYGVDAYVGFVETLEKERGGDPRVMRTDPDYLRDEGDDGDEREPHSIYVFLGGWAPSILDWQRVSANWVFDNDDRLTDIEIERSLEP